MMFTLLVVGGACTDFQKCKKRAKKNSRARQILMAHMTIQNIDRIVDLQTVWKAV